MMAIAHQAPLPLPRESRLRAAALLFVAACASAPSPLYRPARALTGEIVADGVDGIVILRSKSDSSLEMGVVDRENVFSFEVPDGHYSLLVHRDGFENAFIDDVEVVNGVGHLSPLTLKSAGSEARETAFRLPYLISGPNPFYTQEAVQHHVSGLFVAKCRVPLSGPLNNCRVLKHLPMMDDSILQALKHRRYAPALVEGVPAETDYVFRIFLHLPP